MVLNDDRGGEDVRHEGQQAYQDAPEQGEGQHRVRHEHYEQHVPDLVLGFLEAYALAAQTWRHDIGVNK